MQLFLVKDKKGKYKLYQALPLTWFGEKLTALAQTDLKSRDEQDVDNPENSTELQATARTFPKAVLRGEDKSLHPVLAPEDNSKDETNM